MHIDGASDTFTHENSEIVQTAPPDSATHPDDWVPDWADSTVYCGSEYGVGTDNPTFPDTLTDLEVRPRRGCAHLECM